MSIHFEVDFTLTVRENMEIFREVCVTALPGCERDLDPILQHLYDFMESQSPILDTIKEDLAKELLEEVFRKHFAP